MRSAVKSNSNENENVGCIASCSEISSQVELKRERKCITACLFLPIGHAAKDEKGDIERSSVRHGAGKRNEQVVAALQSAPQIRQII